MHYFTWNIDPVLIHFNQISIHWYGALFTLALLSNYLFMHWVYWRELGSTQDVDRLLWYCIGGTVIGARLGHVLFYNPNFYFSHPLKILAIWEGGLASHGGVLGVLLALYLYQRSAPFNYFWILDRAAIAASLSGALIRVGNFFNSEIIGTTSDMPWAIIFSRIDQLPRHPVQLYEACSYFSIFLFLLYQYSISTNWDFKGRLCAWFLILIFSARFLLETFKTELTDHELWISTGQLLSIPFILVGLVLLRNAHKLTPPHA